MTRRRVLGFAGAGALGLAFGACAKAGRSAEPPPAAGMPEPSPGATGALVPALARDATTPPAATPSPTSTPAPTATPTPTPLPAGEETRTLLPGEASQAMVRIRHSGVAGPVLMVLGGVHGNEPGGWMAAEDVAGWSFRAGSLIVLPRANAVAIGLFKRTTDALGDLNRLYPGDPASPFPMERMAAAIVALCREFGVDTVLDLHESWAFYDGRAQDGTAFLGQTVTAGVGPRQGTLAPAIVARVNAELPEGSRDRLILRDGTSFRRTDGTPGAGTPAANAGRGRSSLALGGHGHAASG